MEKDGDRGRVQADTRMLYSLLECRLPLLDAHFQSFFSNFTDLLIERHSLSFYLFFPLGKKTNKKT